MSERKKWEPRPHEAHLFHEIYIDETSQNDHSFLVLGGIVLPRRISEQFEADILAARHPRLLSRDSKGELREIGWSEVSTGDFEAYKKVVDAYFSFANRYLKNTAEAFHFYCSVVSLKVPGRRYTGGERGQTGFNREIYYHCLTTARRHKTYLFHVYPDFRTTRKPISELGLILNRGWAKERVNKDWTFRRVKFRHSHEWQALQISDLLIGAVAYRLNRHYDSPTANRDKKLLCEYILKKTDIGPYIKDRGFKDKPFGQCQLWFRRHKS